MKRILRVKLRERKRTLGDIAETTLKKLPALTRRQSAEQKSGITRVLIVGDLVDLPGSEHQRKALQARAATAGKSFAAIAAETLRRLPKVGEIS